MKFHSTGDCVTDLWILHSLYESAATIGLFIANNTVAAYVLLL